MEPDRTEPSPAMGPKRLKFPLRWNVLVLMGAGYVSVVTVYAGLIFFADEGAVDAY